MTLNLAALAKRLDPPEFIPRLDRVILNLPKVAQQRYAKHLREELDAGHPEPLAQCRAYGRVVKTQLAAIGWTITREAFVGMIQKIATDPPA